MTETRIVSIEEVRTLVAERQRYEDWLAALEAKRAETPVRVFERVHSDYVARRHDVMNRLHEHVGGLTTMVNDFDARLHALDSQLGTLEDERAEAMLRTSVGEFDADRWERVKHDVESQIGQLGGQRTGLSSEIAQTLVTLGVDLSKVNAVGDLQGGIEEAERLLGYTVISGQGQAAKDEDRN